MAPHGTPAATIQRVSLKLEKVLKQPEVQKRFDEQGLSASEKSPLQLSGLSSPRPVSGVALKSRLAWFRSSQANLQAGIRQCWYSTWRVDM